MEWSPIKRSKSSARPMSIDNMRGVKSKSESQSEQKAKKAKTEQTIDNRRGVKSKSKSQSEQKAKRAKAGQTSPTPQDVYAFLRSHYSQQLNNKIFTYQKAMLVVHPDKVQSQMPPAIQEVARRTAIIQEKINAISVKVASMYMARNQTGFDRGLQLTGSTILAVITPWL